MVNCGQVVLLDFFETSPIDAGRWSVVLNAVPSVFHAPAFDETRHAGVCNEVRHNSLLVVTNFNHNFGF